MNNQPAAPELRWVEPQTAGFDPAGLRHVDAVMCEGVESVYLAATILVARQGGVVLHQAYGIMDPANRDRIAHVGHLFDLASVTKLFTVTAFMTLVEAKLVTLDTPLADVLPEFKGTRSIGPTEDPLTKTELPPDPAFVGQEINASKVTFWHLLTHTSGLAAWRSLFRHDGDEHETIPLPHHNPQEQRLDRISAIYSQYGFAYPPGQRIVYSDLGLILLGEAIERLSGRALDHYIRKSVLIPLGLKTATFNPLANGQQVDQIVPTEFCAWRQRRCVGEVHDENAASLGGVAGHAGLFSTAWDVAVLGQTFLNGGRYGSARILEPQTVASMTRVQVDMDDNPRGLGWLQRSRGWSSSGRLFGPRSYGHTGFTGTSLWIDPDRELLVSLLTNRVYFGRDPGAIANFRPRLHDAVVNALEPISV